MVTPGRDWSGLAGPEADLRPTPSAEIPVHLLESALTDARCQRDRARGENGLLATPGTADARVGDVGEALWRAQNLGLAQLLDWAGGAR
jgi:hypothetical protein